MTRRSMAVALFVSSTVSFAGVSEVADAATSEVATPLLGSPSTSTPIDATEVSQTADSVSSAAIPVPTPDEGAVNVIVTYEEGVDVEAQLAEVAPTEVQEVFEEVLDGAAVSVTPSELAKLKADPDVLRVEMVTPVHSQVSSWGLDRIDQSFLPLSGAYGPRPTGSGVRVYVLDTGLDYSHPEFSGRIGPGAYGITDGNGTNDCDGHGTHVSGTIAGATYGVAPGATIIPVRVLDCTGAGSSLLTILGLDWVLTDMLGRTGVRAVVNMSLGGPNSESVNAAVEEVVAAGIPVVVAAGNENQNACRTSPASAPSAITVAASTSNDSRASFSNYGNCVDLFAPGVGITSARLGGGSTPTPGIDMSGTSMASPHVAGAVAVFLGQNPGASVSEVTSHVLSTATPDVIRSISRRTSTVNRLLCIASEGSMSVATTSLPLSMARAAISVPLSADPGAGQYRWRVVDGRLPSGISLSSSGVLTGSTRSTGTFSFTVAASNNSCQSATQVLTLQVVAPLTVSTRRASEARVGVGYSAALSASGGVGGYTWSLISGALPVGLTMNEAGQITGLATTQGTSSFTVQVTSGDFVATKAFSLRVR